MDFPRAFCYPAFIFVACLVYTSDVEKLMRGKKAKYVGLKFHGAEISRGAYKKGRQHTNHLQPKEGLKKKVTDVGLVFRLL